MEWRGNRTIFLCIWCLATLLQGHLRLHAHSYRFYLGISPGEPSSGKPGAYNKHFISGWQQVFAILVISLAKVVKK